MTYTYAARMADDLADHVLYFRWRGIRVLFPFPAYWPLGDVIWPDIGGNARGGFTEPKPTFSCLYFDGVYTSVIDTAWHRKPNIEELTLTANTFKKINDLQFQNL
jgi:hypothetical protein